MCVGAPQQQLPKISDAPRDQRGQLWTAMSQAPLVRGSKLGDKLRLAGLATRNLYNAPPIFGPSPSYVQERKAAG